MRWSVEGVACLVCDFGLLADFGAEELVAFALQQHHVEALRDLMELACIESLTLRVNMSDSVRGTEQ